MTWAAGFYGKIPARGDFVGQGLSTATRQAMDAWCQEVLPASQERLGAAWTPAWMEAPIWRFHVPAALFGPEPVAGLWLPSTDRAGRLYPLIMAITGSRLEACGDLLDQIEAIGLDAIERDVTPDQMTAGLTMAVARCGSMPLQMAEGEWSTKGGPRVAPAGYHLAGLPDGALFAAMLSDRGTGVARTGHDTDS